MIPDTALQHRHRTILDRLRLLDFLHGNPALSKAEADPNADSDAAAMALQLADDLALDSLDVVAAGIECEDEFGCEFEDDEVDGLKTLGDLVALIERKTR